MTGNVVRGPWAAPAPRVQSPPQPQPLHRDRSGRLVKCSDCKVPFHPRKPLPADLVCRDCREARDLAALPTLFDQPP